jgi:putative membrane protein
MSYASAPTELSLLTEWRPDYVVAGVLVLTAVAYVRMRRTASRFHLPWRRHRDVVFAAGLAALLWTCNGFPQARGFQLMWVWMAQELLLLLVVPIVLMSAQPLALIRATYGDHAWPIRILRTRAIRIVGSPLVGPVLVPVLCLWLIFGGLGSFAVSSTWAGGAVHLLLLAAGILIAIPLVDSNDDRTSLAVGLSLGVGFVELILDAFPGIALRFQTHMTLAHFAVGRPTFASVPIDDQHTAGAILWVVAEILDLPFLILAATRWIRADAREAAVLDAELDARQHWAADGAPMVETSLDRPWWLDDPDLPERFGGHRPDPEPR